MKATATKEERLSWFIVKYISPTFFFFFSSVASSPTPVSKQSWMHLKKDPFQWYQSNLIVLCMPSSVEDKAQTMGTALCALQPPQWPGAVAKNRLLHRSVGRNGCGSITLFTRLDMQRVLNSSN